ncbi:sporulation integral membrane protein YtvI [Alicyclobacillus sp. SO9]|nr:sporulation integral membrane protein YtvI [Alicyclobacillus sp. SO9]
MWRAVEVASLLLLVTLVCIGFALFLPYILPFVFGGFLAILLLPLVRILERMGTSRITAVLIIMIGVGVIVALASTYIIIALTREATTLSTTLPSYINSIQTWLTVQLQAGRTFYGHLPPQVANGIQNAAGQLLTATESLSKQFFNFLFNSVTRLPEWTFIIVISVIATFFMMVNRERMYHSFLRALPPGWSEKVDVAMGDMMRAFAGSIRVQVLLMIMSAVLGIFGLWILNVNYAVLFGLLFGVTGMIPIVGSAIVSIPWAAGALAVGSVGVALKVLLVQVAISLIRHMVEPKILADSVGLDTLSTLFALYVGMKLIGVLGLFLGPIVLIGVKSLLRMRLFVDIFPSYDHVAVQTNLAEKKAAAPADKDEK